MIQALLFLQGRPQITAAELAAELEVSVPTARRDLEALTMAGVPLYPTRGRGGGWRLVGGARTDLTGLTQQEATALLIGITQGSDDSPARAQALRKLMRAMPAPFREGAERVASATVREPSWGTEGQGGAPRHVAVLQGAVADRRRVRAEYEGAAGPVELVPLIVGSRGDTWYLIAAPTLAGQDTADAARLRTYRVDRIRTLTVQPDAGLAPTDFDHAVAWRDMVARVEDLRGAVRATVRVEPYAAGALRRFFGAQAGPMTEAAVGETDGRVRLEVRAHRVDALAEQLAGWTAVAEVIEPAEVRAALHDLGARLVDVYAPR